MAAKGQFHRFYLCIDQIEKAFPLYFDAFLRLRTDTVVLGALPDVLLPDPKVLYTKWRCKLRIRPPLLTTRSPPSAMRLRSNYNEALAIKEHFRDEFDCGLCEQRSIISTSRSGWQGSKPRMRISRRANPSFDSNFDS